MAQGFKEGVFGDFNVVIDACVPSVHLPALSSQCRKLDTCGTMQTWGQTNISLLQRWVKLASIVLEQWLYAGKPFLKPWGKRSLLSDVKHLTNSLLICFFLWCRNVKPRYFVLTCGLLGCGFSFFFLLRNQKWACILYV